MYVALCQKHIVLLLYGVCAAAAHGFPFVALRSVIWHPQTPLLL
jgi:predicted membrane protein